MATETSRQDLPSIQILRGIAALMVVVFHTKTQLVRMGKPVDLGFLSAGVDIFFVISGFIMWISTEHAKDRTAIAFFRNRLIRIVPLYWCVTLAVAAMALLAPRLLQSTSVDPALVLASLFFIAWPNAGLGKYEPLVAPGWTLNLEMFFYLTFTVAIAGSREPFRRGVIVAALILAAVVLRAAVPGLPPSVAFYGNGIVLEFLFGIGLGYLHANLGYRSSRLWWAVCAAGFGLLMVSNAFPELPDFIARGLPATMIVAGAIFAPAIHIAPLRRLGDSSYALYLSHVIALSAFAQLWRKFGLSYLPAFVFIGAACFVCVAVGWLVYRWVELPSTDFARSFVRRRAERPAGSMTSAGVTGNLLSG